MIIQYTVVHSCLKNQTFGMQYFSGACTDSAVDL